MLVWRFISIKNAQHVGGKPLRSDIRWLLDLMLF